MTVERDIIIIILQHILFSFLLETGLPLSTLFAQFKADYENVQLFQSFTFLTARP